MKARILLISIFCCFCSLADAQIGEHRDVLSLGFNGGYIMSNVGFDPSVSQNNHGGITGGLSFRYTCEKYFNTICSVYAEVNYASLGWKEKIVDIKDAAVIDPETKKQQQYSRTVNYIQIPFLAHLAWGKEEKGMQFFVNAGPQIGLYLSESTKSNFNVSNEITRIKAGTSQRSNTIWAQDTMSVENKLDYGIAAGVGMEYVTSHAGRFLLESRYYYGMGNIFGNSKRDYFGKSNYGNVIVKLSWLFDIRRTKK